MIIRRTLTPFVVLFSIMTLWASDQLRSPYPEHNFVKSSVLRGVKTLHEKLDKRLNRRLDAHKNPLWLQKIAYRGLARAKIWARGGEMPAAYYNATLQSLDSKDRSARLDAIRNYQRVLNNEPLEKATLKFNYPNLSLKGLRELYALSRMVPALYREKALKNLTFDASGETPFTYRLHGNVHLPSLVKELPLEGLNVRLPENYTFWKMLAYDREKFHKFYNFLQSSCDCGDRLIETLNQHPTLENVKFSGNTHFLGDFAYRLLQERPESIRYSVWPEGVEKDPALAKYEERTPYKASFTFHEGVNADRQIGREEEFPDREKRRAAEEEIIRNLFKILPNYPEDNFLFYFWESDVRQQRKFSYNSVCNYNGDFYRELSKQKPKNTDVYTTNAYRGAFANVGIGNI